MIYRDGERGEERWKNREKMGRERNRDRRMFINSIVSDNWHIGKDPGKNYLTKPVRVPNNPGIEREMEIWKREKEREKEEEK
jgi:hypothetical protein